MKIEFLDEHRTRARVTRWALFIRGTWFARVTAVFYRYDPGIVLDQDYRYLWMYEDSDDPWSKSDRIEVARDVDIARVCKRRRKEKRERQKLELRSKSQHWVPVSKLPTARLLSKGDS